MDTHLSLRGVIFDLDGTLADTIPVCRAAFRRAYQEHTGRHFTDAEIDATFGPSEEGSFRRIVAADRWEACMQTFLEEYEAAHALCPDPFPGVIELLSWLDQHGVQVAVVTGKGDRSAAISLKRLGLTPHFKMVETGSADGPIKPQAIRKVLTQWALPPDQVAYVGDMPADVSAAREAGVLPLSAAWATAADAARLEAMKPAALFFRIDKMTAWLQAHAQGPERADG